MSDEQWRPVVGAPEYWVSDLGRVASTKMTRFKLLTPSIKRGDYRSVCLYVAGNRAHHTIHSLVLSAFVGPRPEGMEVRHLDGAPSNNSLNNLAWGTKSEQAADKKRHGTDPSCNTHCKRGHELTEENTYRRPKKPEWRWCRTCLAIRDVERRQRRRAARYAAEKRAA